MCAICFKILPENSIVYVFSPVLSLGKKKKNVYQVFNTNANVFSHCFDRSPSFLPPPRGLLTICTPNKEMLHMFICTQNCIKPF